MVSTDFRNWREEVLYYKILSMLLVKLSIKRPPSNAWAAWLVAGVDEIDNCVVVNAASDTLIVSFDAIMDRRFMQI